MYKNPPVHEIGNVNSNLVLNDYKNQELKFKNGIFNQANNNSLNYRKFEEIPNEFADNVNYPSFENIEYDANTTNDGLIKRYIFEI